MSTWWLGATTALGRTLQKLALTIARQHLALEPRVSVGICAAGLPPFSCFSMLLTDKSVSMSGTRADLIVRFSFGGHLIGENRIPHFSNNMALWPMGPVLINAILLMFTPT